MLDQTDAPRVIVQTKQEVDDQAEKRTVHEETLEANSTEIPEEVAETENALDQSLNETTELGKTETPEDSKTEQTSSEISSHFPLYYKSCYWYSSARGYSLGI